MLRIATRGSPLARWQAEEVARLLRDGHPGAEVGLLVVETTGDRRQDLRISDMGGQGVFVKEVQAAVLAGRADLAVHSAKDLPSLTAPGLCLAAIPERADPRDALVGARLDDLAPGATIATGAVRRRAQLAWLRPDLTYADLRGNIATRLERIPPGGAVVVAAAALVRLGLLERAAEILDLATLLPQAGQGAIAVECRADDATTAGMLLTIDDRRARLAVTAERGFLARLGGGCELPVGAHGWLDADGTLRVEGLLASLDGRVSLRATKSGRGSGPDVGSDSDVGSGPDVGSGTAWAATLGEALAEDLLERGGGAELLAWAAGERVPGPP